jgi:aspartate aminotransferase-like enzyme
MNEGYGAVIAGGQKHMSSDLFRLGHIGFFGRSDILTMVSSLELSLRDLGYSAKPGEATTAAQDVYATA